MKNNIVQYYVEGENEKCLLEQLKNIWLIPGKVEVLNVLQKEIRNTRIRTFSSNTTVVLIFDIDVNEYSRVEKLNENIKTLLKSNHVREIILIPQIRNFEEELLYCTDLKRIENFIPGKSISEFKKGFNKLGVQIISRLKQYNFNIDLFWSRKIPEDSIFFEIDKSLIKPEKVKMKPIRIP